MLTRRRRNSATDLDHNSTEISQKNRTGENQHRHKPATKNSKPGTKQTITNEDSKTKNKVTRCCDSCADSDEKTQMLNEFEQIQNAKKSTNSRLQNYKP